MMHLFTFFIKTNETHGNINLFLSKYFIGPIGYYDQSSTGSNLRQLWENILIIKKILSLFLFILFFWNPILQFCRKRKNILIKIYDLSDLLMLDFWLHKNLGYFSNDTAVYEIIKLLNHYTFLVGFRFTESKKVRKNIFLLSTHNKIINGKYFYFINSSQTM